MKYLAARMTLAMIPLALLTVASTAIGGNASVVPDGVTYSSPLPPDGTLRAITGSVTPFGPINGVLRAQTDLNTGVITGEFVFLAKGGWVQGTLNGQVFPNPDPTSLTYFETLTFTGGGGKFSRISGTADILGIINLHDGTGVDHLVGGQVKLR